jgi:hypothetical protein
VDDGEVRAEAYNGRIVLSRVLTEDASMLPQLASYAVGRILKESAVLSCDEKAKAFLWQDASLDSGERGMLRLFETFMNSCDWWRERIDAMGGNGSGAGEEDETMKIRP